MLYNSTNSKHIFIGRFWQLYGPKKNYKAFPVHLVHTCTCGIESFKRSANQEAKGALYKFSPHAFIYESGYKDVQSIYANQITPRINESVDATI